MVFTNNDVYVYMYTCMDVIGWLDECMCVCIYMHVCMYTCMYVYIYKWCSPKTRGTVQGAQWIPFPSFRYGKKTGNNENLRRKHVT